MDDHDSSPVSSLVKSVVSDFVTLSFSASNLLIQKVLGKAWQKAIGPLAHHKEGKAYMHFVLF